MSVFIIAEAGVNHNGDLAMAKQLVDAACEAGADCIKFQTFHAESLVSKRAKKAAYQQRQTGGDDSQLAMLRQLELSQDAFLELRQYCAQVGVAFATTPFDLESIRFAESLSMPFWKIPSGEITNLPYLIQVAKQKGRIILSTGMCTLDEVRAALAALREHGARDITLLHCTTQYPAPYEDVNLRAMQTLAREFSLPVGYSDHTPGIEVPVAAAALGATVIEKHFTLDKTLPGPDHKASLDPRELAAMVTAIRHVEAALGDGVKQPTTCEWDNLRVARKSIVASRPIRKGERFTEENLTAKRPGDGISPMRWFDVIGQDATRDFDEDEPVVL